MELDFCAKFKFTDDDFLALASSFASMSKLKYLVFKTRDSDASDGALKFLEKVIDMRYIARIDLELSNFKNLNGVFPVLKRMIKG